MNRKGNNWGTWFWIILVFIIAIVPFYNYYKYNNNEILTEESADENKTNKSTVKQTQPEKIPYNQEIELESKYVQYLPLEEENYKPINIEFNIRSDSEVEIYFIPSKQAYDDYVNFFAYPDGPFSYYKGCYKINTQNFSGNCVITTGGLMIGNKRKTAHINIQLNISEYEG